MRSSLGACSARARVVACVSRMITFTSTVSIRRAQGEVFSVLTDFDRYLARWAKGPIAARKTSPGDTSVGTRFEVTAKAGIFRVRSPYQVLAFEPPRRFGGRGVAGPVRFEEEYRLSGNEISTLLEQTIRARPRGPFRLAERAIEKQLRRLIPADLERLRALVESTSTSE